MAGLEMLVGRFDDAKRLLLEARELLASVGDDRALLAEVALRDARMAMSRRDLPAARAIANDAVERMRALGAATASAMNEADAMIREIDGLGERAIAFHGRSPRHQTPLLRLALAEVSPTTLRADAVLRRAMLQRTQGLAVPQ
jgi:hypothetical protein